MPTSRSSRSAVVVVGRGRVGRSLTRAARAAGVSTRSVAGRSAAPIGAADLVVVAVPDGEVSRVAERLVDVGRGCAVVHVAGVLAPDHLGAARARGWSVGQAHPLAAIAGPSSRLGGATLLVGGDPLAVARARALARSLGMRALLAPSLDRALWHAVAALVAGGAAALAAHGTSLLEAAGVPAVAARVALAGLLASVARNVAERGGHDALTGPVRRGDVGTVERHVRAFERARAGPAVVDVYAALALAQIELARTVGEATATSLARIETAVRRARRRRKR